MIFGKAIVWTVRLLLVSLFVAFLLIIGSSFSDSVASTHQLEFQKLYFDVMPQVVRGGIVYDSYFSDTYLEQIIGDQSRIGFTLWLQDGSDTIKQIYYKKTYYTSRIYLVKGESYFEYAGSFPVEYNGSEVDLYYSYLVAK